METTRLNRLVFGVALLWLATSLLLLMYHLARTCRQPRLVTEAGSGGPLRAAANVSFTY
jgi:hypothetical protein